jgi:hypothetical protein
MSSTLVKVAFALLMVLASPAPSFARHAGSAATGNVPISGTPRGQANAGGMNNVVVDPSGGRKLFQNIPAAAAAHKRPDNSAVQVIAKRTRDFTT